MTNDYNQLVSPPVRCILGLRRHSRRSSQVHGTVSMTRKCTLKKIEHTVCAQGCGSFSQLTKRVSTARGVRGQADCTKGKDLNEIGMSKKKKKQGGPFTKAVEAAIEYAQSLTEFNRSILWEVPRSLTMWLC